MNSAKQLDIKPINKINSILYTYSKQSENEIKETTPFTIANVIEKNWNKYNKRSTPLKL